MATVNKDFRVKNGLIVEGSSGTINGSNILTESSTTFLDNKIEDVAGALLSGATLTNIQIAYDTNTNGLTITAENGVADSNTDDLAEGLTNLYFTDERAQDAIGAAITNGTQTNITVTYDDANNVYNFVAENGVADSTTTDLAEGTNLYFTEERAQDAAAALFSGSHNGINFVYDDANGVITATVTGSSIPTFTGGINFEGATEDDFELLLSVTDPTADRTVVIKDESGTLALESDITDHSNTTSGVHGVTGDVVGTSDAQTLTNKTIDGSSNTLSNIANSSLVNDSITINGTATALGGSVTLDTGDVAENGNLYYTDARARAAVSAEANGPLTYNSTTGEFDVDVSTGLTVNAGALEVNRTVTDTWYDASGSASTAESNANSYTDSLIGDATVNGTAGNTVTDRIATAVANLVDSAPATLDTLNELAAAIGDDANFVTTLTTSIGEKVAKSGDTMTGALTLSGAPTADLHAATKKYVDDAETALNSTIGALDTDDIAEGTKLYFTDARAVDAIEAVVPNFTEIDIDSLATQVAAQVSASTASTQYTAYAFAKATYRSAKFLVKVAYGSHTEVSEVLVTLDTSDNIAITEYAVVGTNGSASTISAGINGTDVELYVTPTNNSSTVTVMGTLIK